MSSSGSVVRLQHLTSARRAVIASVLGAVLSVTAPALGAAPEEPEGSVPTDAVAQGFGAGATGGAGGEEYWVTTLEDSGPGSLRAGAERDGPRWIRFALSGELKLDRPVRVASDLTIDGRGARVTITGSGLYLIGVGNVVIINLRFRGGIGSETDAIQIRDGTRHVWIAHSDFADYPDGLIDITQYDSPHEATDITVSWSRFSDHDKVMLVNLPGHSAAASRVTVHHNLFDGTHQRQPFVSHAQVHAFNNYLRGWTGYGMQSSTEGQLLSQSNVFEPPADAETHRRDAIRTRDDADNRPGAVRSVGDLFLDANVELRWEDRVFQPPYSAAIDPASLTLAATVEEYAGWHDVPYVGATPPSPEPESPSPSVDGAEDDRRAARSDSGAATSEDAGDWSRASRVGAVVLLVVGAAALARRWLGADR